MVETFCKNFLFFDEELIFAIKLTKHWYFSVQLVD